MLFGREIASKSNTNAGDWRSFFEEVINGLSALDAVASSSSCLDNCNNFTPGKRKGRERKTTATTIAPS